jgi:hypothetical protein
MNLHFFEDADASLGLPLQISNNDCKPVNRYYGVQNNNGHYIRMLKKKELSL